MHHSFALFDAGDEDVKMNVSLARKILKLTPKHVLDPSKGAPSIDTPLPLSTGATIPALGLATWQTNPEPDQIYNAVLLAIKSGYRHFDTKSNNEVEVGKAIHDALSKGSVKRENLFVTARLKTPEDFGVQDLLDASLKNLKLDYVDLFVIDYNETSFEETWRVMEKLPATNKTKAIGVANFSLHALEKLLSNTKSIPAVNQVESNPFETSNDVIQLCHDKIIHVTARSPFRSETDGSLFNHESVVKIADKHNAVPESVLLSWHLTRGSSVLVDEVILGGGNEENRKLLQLSREDMDLLDEISWEKEALRQD